MSEESKSAALDAADVELRRAQALKEAAQEDYLRAQAARERAELLTSEADARRAVAGAEIGEILLAREREGRELELTANHRHKVYVFDQEVGEDSVKKCIAQLTVWARQDPQCDIEIQVNSPGGSIFDGFALIDFIRDLQAKGHRITMVALGMAASMAGVLLQVADQRAMGANCLMLIHEGSFGAIGDYGAVEDRVELMKLMHEKILALFAAKSTLTTDQIRDRWYRKDWWMTAEEALEHAFIDEVR